MNYTALNSTFWKTQLYKHFERFYPEWIRDINNPGATRSRALYFYRHRPLQAEQEFKTMLDSTSIDQALESAMQLLTVDLPEPIYPEVLKVLDEMQMEDIPEEKVVDLCVRIRSDHPKGQNILVNPQIIAGYLNI